MDGSATRIPLGLDSGSLETIVATAVRAPSLHNTQPWRFRTTDSAIELYVDPSRRLDVLDPDGREMVLSCGAALFGLRLGVRQAGLRPVVELLPSGPRRGPLARVHLGAPAAGPGDRHLLAGVWRRHTHRGPFAPEPLPRGLLAALRRDAEVEATTLRVIDSHWSRGVGRLVDIAESLQARHAALTAETAAWAGRGDVRDGVPARAFPARPATGTSRLRQRDFDLARNLGMLAADEVPPAATVVLLTPGDGPADWLRAGQALHRVLLRAASSWVFASLHTQPLEVVPLRDALRAHLAMAGAPQMLMQLGRAHTAPLTWRRPVAEVLAWD